MTPKKRLEFNDPRYWYQNAKLAIRDIYDAIVELLTNADDAYSRSESGLGRIEIEVERRRKGTPCIIRVRDFATGMTSDEMDEKLARIGDRRHSGLADGALVRGTNSRGAKDVAALGVICFESIDTNGRYSKRRINKSAEFDGEGQSEPATSSLRNRIGIRRGSGTLVTIEVDPESVIQIPRHEKMLNKLKMLVPLRDIFSDPSREVSLRDLTKGNSLPPCLGRYL